MQPAASSTALLQDEGLKALLLQEGLVNPGSHGGAAMNQNNVTVAVRVRPMSDMEQTIDNRICVETRGEARMVKPAAGGEDNAADSASDATGADDDFASAAPDGLSDTQQQKQKVRAQNQVTLTCSEDQRRYNSGFQAVFGMNTTQAQVFNGIAKDIVEATIQGFNGTIFAYGQTGAGKTFTMVGPHHNFDMMMMAAAANSAAAAASKHHHHQKPPSTYFDPEIGIASPQLNLNKQPTTSSGSSTEDPAVSAAAAAKNNEMVIQHSQRGIIPRAATHIFERLQSMYGAPPATQHQMQQHQALLANPRSRAAAAAAQQQRPGGEVSYDYSVTLTFVEIYLDRVRDLIETNRVNLPIREKDGAFFVDHVSEHSVSSASDVLKLLDKGARNRATSSSRMNDRSSRSHSILTLSIWRHSGSSSTDKQQHQHGASTCGKLQLIDLAGSERVGKSGTNISNTQLDEACSINKSLSHLSEVISAVLDGRPHVPYRSCALTKLLSSSLGGNARTALVVCCSPSSYNEGETLSSLRFGSSASGIRNRATMNRLVTEEQMRKYVSKLWHVIRLLEKDNDVLRVRLGDIPPEQLVALPASVASARALLQQRQQFQQEGVAADQMPMIADRSRSYESTSETSFPPGFELLSQSGQPLDPSQVQELLYIAQQHLMHQQPQQQNTGSPPKTPTPPGRGGRHPLTSDDLAFQFVNSVARFAGTTSGAGESGGALSSSMSPDRLVHLHQRSQSPAAASFGTDMQFVLSQTTQQLNSSNNNVSPPASGVEGGGGGGTPSAEAAAAAGSGIMNENQLQDDEPVTSREYSPPPGEASHQQQQVTPTTVTPGQHQRERRPTAAPTAPTSGGQQQRQHDVTEANQQRYVNLLKEMNDAINDMDAETEEGDEILRNLEQKKKDDDVDASLPVLSPSSARHREQALVEKLRLSEESKETLQLNMAMWQSAMRDVDRNRRTALAQMERQSIQISSLISDLDSAKGRYEKAESALEKLQNQTNSLFSRAEQERLLTRERSGSNSENGVGGRRRSSSRSPEMPPPSEQPPKKSVANFSMQTDIQMADLRNDWLAEFSIRVPPVTTSTASGGAVVGDTDYDDVEALNSNSTTAAHSNQTQSPSNPPSPQKQQQRAMKACEAYLSRALRAEDACSNATALVSKYRSEKEELDMECSSLRRQVYVMEQRIVALSRLSHATSANAKIRSNLVGSGASAGTVRLAGLYGSAAGGAGGAAAAAAHDDDGAAAEQNPGSPTSSSMSEHDMKDLQTKNRDVESAVERLQKRTAQAQALLSRTQ